MSASNPLVGLLGQYGSDDDSDEEVAKSSRPRNELQSHSQAAPPAPFPPEPVVHDGSVHPAPVPHCPWSACYDESSGFTYYWNQQTNAVTWEAPQEYLLALKLAQQQINTAGSAEVSAEEWQLYQQALAEKEITQKVEKAATKVSRASDKPGSKQNGKNNKRRSNSDSEDEKIELITSYYHTDSESNDEESPTKKPPPKPVTPPSAPKNPAKKQKTKPQSKPIEYGPPLPPNQNYTVPIGPEMPPELIPPEPEVISPSRECRDEPSSPKESKSSPKPLETEDEDSLLTKLKDKAKLLEKLGGEIPKDIENLIKDETKSSPTEEPVKNGLEMNIDDLLEEIEKKELPRAKNKDLESTEPKSEVAEANTLFPSSQNIESKSLFPCAVNIVENEIPENKIKEEKSNTEVEKKSNIYLQDSEHVKSKKKLRISNSVLPERKMELPAYTTKYSQFVEGFSGSGERTGLGFKQTENDPEPKKAISYGGLMFTKGETLNEKDETLEDSIDLLEAKLKFLNQQQVYQVSPVQEMAIQMQTLIAAHRAASLAAPYLSAWLAAAAAALARLEAGAAPPGWTVAFHRASGRYEYRRESDGVTQWEYPVSAAADDMDICTTPPHVPEYKQVDAPPPLPPAPPPAKLCTPPPPSWDDPPPPGCDDGPPPPRPPLNTLKTTEPKKEIGDELQSFYNDIAELENSPTVSIQPSPERVEVATPPPPPPPPPKVEKEKEKEKEPKKKKTKVKISSTVGLKHKSVSSLVAKWQQVAEEIHSD